MEVDRKIELTNDLELVIIELAKAKKLLNKKKLEGNKNLIKWIKFLIEPSILEEEEMDDMSDELKKAYDEWQKLNINKAERDAAERRYLDLLSIEYAKEYEKKVGRKEGRKEEKLIIAKKLLKENVDIEMIEKVTGVTKEELTD